MFDPRRDLKKQVIFGDAIILACYIHFIWTLHCTVDVPFCKGHTLVITLKYGALKPAGHLINIIASSCRIGDSSGPRYPVD